MQQEHSDGWPCVPPPGDLLGGVDEVGRGALFGPVVAAVVVLSDSGASRLQALGVKDSKQLSPGQRQKLWGVIAEWAVCWQVGSASVAEIDRLNILQGSLLAMQRAVRKLTVTPSLCLVDGLDPIPGISLAQKTVVKGDEQEVAIAAASIIAKVWRDELITRLDPLFPEYDLRANKGYGTEKHRIAISRYGRSCLHRRSFQIHS